MFRPFLFNSFKLFLRKSKVNYSIGYNNTLIIGPPEDPVSISFDHDNYVRIYRINNNKFYLMVPANTVNRLINKINKFSDLLNPRLVSDLNKSVFPTPVK
jgi:hypothetical protein